MSSTLHATRCMRFIPNCWRMPPY